MFKCRQCVTIIFYFLYIYTNKTCTFCCFCFLLSHWCNVPTSWAVLAVCTTCKYYDLLSNSQEWNDELAGVAQAYLTKCTTQPNPNRASQAPSFSTVGENSGVSIPPSSGSFGQVVGFWFNGCLLYNYTTEQCFRDGACDTYTQVGCAHVYMYKCTR